MSAGALSETCVRLVGGVFTLTPTLSLRERGFYSSLYFGIGMEAIIRDC